MPTNELKLVQVSPRVQARGGIETLHEYHARLPAAQQFVALFDRDPRVRAGYLNLDFTWRTPLWLMRRRFAEAMAPHAGALVIYSNGWGLPLFHDLDHAARRIVACYAHPPFHAPDLPSFAGLVDGALGITPAMAASWAGGLPELSAGRTAILPMPIEPPEGAKVERTVSDRIVLGYAGRVERIDKRLDRLPAFLSALRATGRRFRFEVLGDGTVRAALQRELGDQVKFHGWLPKNEYWRVMSRWDAAVYFTDVDGGPIALLEAMAMGALPFFPAIGGSLGDDYTPKVNASGYYPPGDMVALARAVDNVFAQTTAEIAAARDRAQAMVAAHRESRYGKELMNFVATIAGKPRIAAVRRRRPRVADALPLGLVTRVAPWALRAS